jgi:hypothetical protein
VSRTVRSLPVGKSKKYGRIGYYNRVPNFNPLDIHLLRNPLKPQSRGWHEPRYGLYLHKPYGAEYVPTAWLPAPSRGMKRSNAGPIWVDGWRYHEEKFQHLIRAGWTHEWEYESRRYGPEEWAVDNYVRVGPRFYKHRLWVPNPDWDEDADDAYYNWNRVHEIVCRNGHYKGHRQGYRKWMRRAKQADHQVRRRRLVAELRDLVEEAMIGTFPHGR